MSIKTIGFLGAVLSLSLTACTTLNQLPHSTQQVSSKIEKASINQPIIAYFTASSADPDDEHSAEYSPKAVAKGYYRILLGRDDEGRFLLQDYYADSKKPQSLPFWIKDPDGLTSFQDIYVDGPLTILSENGKTFFKATMQDYEPIGKAQSFYQNGQIALENDFETFGEIHQKLWYENGKPAADAVLDLDHQIIKAQFWNLQGELVTDDDEIQAITDAIEQKLSSMS